MKQKKNLIKQLFVIDGDLKGAIENSRFRLSLGMTLIILLYVSLIWRALDLMIWSDRSAIVTKWHSNSDFKYRGTIYDRNGVIIAMDLPASSLYLDSLEFLRSHDSVEDAALKLVKVFPDLDKNDIKKKLLSRKHFVWIKRKITPYERYAVNSLGIPGARFDKDSLRKYPQGNLFSHALGYVGIDGKGLAGLELYEDKTLRVKGRDLILSLDSSIQYIIREQLKATIEKFKALAGAAVLLDVNNGEILSFNSYPDYDSNFVNEASDTQLFNRVTKGVYELGSVFKTVTIAAALDSKSVSLYEKFDGNSPIRVGKFTIHNYEHIPDNASIAEIFAYSSNIGSSRIVSRLGRDKFRYYLDKLGLTRGLKVELWERSRPLLPKVWYPASTLTISYGHGIAVTLLHVAKAFATTVNGGYSIEPTLFHNKLNSVEKRERVFSEQTSNIMRRLLRRVVEQGTARKVEVYGYKVGAKTGTADKVSTSGGYSKDNRIATLAVAFPINAPKYALLIMIDSPKPLESTKGFATAGWVVAPMAKEVIERIAPMLEIPSNFKKAPKISKKNPYFIRPRW